MTRTLSEFLHEYAEKHRAEAEAIRARREEWVTAVESLMRQVKQWAEDADKGKVLLIRDDTRELAEPKLGRYTAAALTINLGDQKVVIRPVGWQTIGRIGPDGNSGPRAEGRVDMELEDSPIRHVLLRGLDEHGERWVILNYQLGEPRPLDRQTFEAALLSLLR